MYTTTLYHHQLSLSAQYNNAWNQRYSIAGFRPMPLANWLIGFRLEL